MNLKIIGVWSLIIFIGAAALISIPAFADNEPNDSLDSCETISEGTHTGSVSLNDTYDCYVISVPTKKDIKVTGEKTDSGSGSITIRGYNHDRESMSIFGIWIILSSPGERETDSYWNSEGSARNVYLEVEGEGDYEITIEFTDDSQDTAKGLMAACGLGLAGIICIPLLFIAFVIIVIIVIVKVTKKKKK